MNHHIDKTSIMLAFLVGVNSAIGGYFIEFAFNHPYENSYHISQIIGGALHIAIQLSIIVFMLKDATDKIGAPMLLGVICDLWFQFVVPISMNLIFDMSLIEPVTCISLGVLMALTWGFSIFFVPSRESTQIDLEKPITFNQLDTIQLTPLYR